MKQTAAKPKQKKKSIFLRIALVAFAVYMVVVLVQLQMEISDRQKDIDSLQAQILQQQRLNEDLQNKVENTDLYLEQQARDDGYVRPGEDVFQEVPG